MIDLSTESAIGEPMGMIGWRERKSDFGFMEPRVQKACREGDI